MSPSRLSHIDAKTYMYLENNKDESIYTNTLNEEYVYIHG